MGAIKGITVLLHEKVQIGKDGFNKPIYETKTVEVENVLVSPELSDDLPTTISLEGKKMVYVLGIPKSDTHEWEDTFVEFFGHKWKTIGFATQGIETLIPLDWNKKIKVEKYE